MDTESWTHIKIQYILALWETFWAVVVLDSVSMYSRNEMVKVLYLI